MTHMVTSLRRLFTLVAFAALLGTERDAHAGDSSSVRIAAATADAKYAAIFNVTNDYANGTGALIAVHGKSDDKELGKPLANATCLGDGGKVAPFARWKWSNHVPALGRLIPFVDAYDDKSEGKRTRVVVDRDTRLSRIEIWQGDRWWAVKALPGAAAKLTGTALLSGRYLIRTHHTRDLSEWDEVSAFTEEDVPRIQERWEKARAEAAVATADLRKLHAEGARPFTKRPNGQRDGDAWDHRRAKALDPAIEKWAIAAAFGPLAAEELREMIWLLDAREAQGWKLEALRLMIGLRERNPAAADPLLADLERASDTADLVPLLRTAQDPLRRLPDPTLKVLTREDLTPLSSEELRWLHRMIRAQGRFRFSDPLVMDYFSLFAWYKPVSARTWQKLVTDEFFLKDPDKSALIRRTQTLQAILEVEKERGVDKPAL
jgi:hypothetical protein